MHVGIHMMLVLLVLKWWRLRRRRRIVHKVILVDIYAPQVRDV